MPDLGGESGAFGCSGRDDINAAASYTCTGA